MSQPTPTTENRKIHRTTLTVEPLMRDEVKKISAETGVKPMVALRWLPAEGIAYYRLQHQHQAGHANGTKPKARRKPGGSNPQARDGPQQLLWKNRGRLCTRQRNNRHQ